jgi:hypothetical protein
MKGFWIEEFRLRNNFMNCPCCSGKLLQHIGRTGLYWYCLDCRQAMPILESKLFPKSLCVDDLKVVSENQSTYRPQLWLFIPLKPRSAVT